MKIRIIVFSSFFIIVFALLYVFVISDWLEKTYSNANYCLSEEEKELLQSGDIILRKGYGFVSNRIIESLNDSLDISHCGIIVKTDTAWIVVHAIPGKYSIFSKQDGVIVSSLSKFVEDAQPNSIIVTRLKREYLQPMERKALFYAEQKTPFDYNFDLNDSTSLYCSELILRILADEYEITSTMLDIKEKDTPPPFSVFLNPGLFEIIIGH